MSEDMEPGSHESTPVVKSTSVMRRVVIYGGVLLVVFLLGLVPMWLQARASADRLAEAERRLTLAGMQGNLASAAIDARRGDYEPARQAVSQFFTSLRAEIDEGETSNFTEAQRAGVQPFFAGVTRLSLCSHGATPRPQTGCPTRMWHTARLWATEALRRKSEPKEMK